MLRSLLFCLVIFSVLSACSSSTQASPTLSEHIILDPSATPTAKPTSSPAPTPILPTIQPRPTIDLNFVRDDFVETLDAQWSWVREDPENWSLAAIPGALQINVSDGYVLAHSNSNLLLRPAPEGNFQIETQLSLDPNHNFEFAGLIIYESDANFIQAGRGYCSSVDCIGDGLYMNSYQKGVVLKPSFGQPYTYDTPVFLRLSRREGTYTFENSQNGDVWFFIGRHTNTINPLQIGLVASQNLRGEIVPAIFGYFEVRSLP